MATDLEAMLDVLADEDTVLDTTTDGPRITARTREMFASASDATSAAQELLEDVLTLGYRLRGGLIGAERPDTRPGSPWQGELVDVQLVASA